jgi:glutamyl-tRNA synthetase
LFAEGLEKSEIKDYVKKISKIINEINKLEPEEQEVLLQKHKDEISEREVKKEGELPELPLTKHQEKNGIVMRFAPSPSGALHVGHAISGCLNFVYVQRYNGKFYVRIEDTNPENIYPPAYELIEQDSNWLFNNSAEIIIQSDRMEIYYKYAKKLINKYSAYVCSCSQEEFKEISKNKKECSCRKQTKKENLKKWEKMLRGNYDPGEVILRFKTPDETGGMKHKNPAMRDFPLARINETNHPRQGKKYRVWPLMNLSVPVDDIELKMTHIIRAKEHRDNAQRQKMIFKILGKKYPWDAYLGRWHIKGLRLSASEITRGVENGKYSGWSDKNLPTIQALKKQRYQPEAFWRLTQHIGLKEVDKTIEKNEFFRLLKMFNK